MALQTSYLSPTLLSKVRVSVFPASKRSANDLPYELQSRKPNETR
jgi:hypothetical protein